MKKLKICNIIFFTICVSIISSCSGGSGGAGTSGAPTSPSSNPPIVAPLKTSTLSLTNTLSLQSIIIDSVQNLYFGANNAIFKVTPNGVQSAIAGTSGSSGCENTSDGLGYTRFGPIMGMAVDSSGNIFISDGNLRVRKVSSTGVVTAIAGQCMVQGKVNGTGTGAQFFSPRAIVIDASGNLLVADLNVVRKVTQAGVVTTFAGTGSGGLPQDSPNPLNASFGNILGMVIDSSNNLYVFDGDMRKIAPNGNVSTVYAGGGGAVDGIAAPKGPGDLGYTSSLAIDKSDNLYVTDAFYNRVRKIDTQGLISTLAGVRTNSCGYLDDILTSARFCNPSGLAIDSSYSVIVLDESNSKIRRIPQQ